MEKKDRKPNISLWVAAAFGIVAVIAALLLLTTGCSDLVSWLDDDDETHCALNEDMVYDPVRLDWDCVPHRGSPTRTVKPPEDDDDDCRTREKRDDECEDKRP